MLELLSDPQVWTGPWSGEMPLRKFDGPLFEYACHEGNYGLANILRGELVSATPSLPAGTPPDHSSSR